MFSRHGNGPLVTEDDTLRTKLPEPHNGNDGWQGRFRLGHFDAVAARSHYVPPGMSMDWRLRIWIVWRRSDRKSARRMIRRGFQSKYR